MLEEKRWAFEQEQLFFFFFFLKIPSAVNAALQGPLKKFFFLLYCFGCTEVLLLRVGFL